MPANNPLRCSHSAMIQRGSNEVVLLDTGSYPGFSNYLNQTWTWNGTDWTRVGPGITTTDSTGPLPLRANFAMTYDGYAAVLYGGQGESSLSGAQQDTWLWNGTTWTKQAPVTSPFGRWKAELAFLNVAGAQKAVLFGGTNGNNFLKETWSWNGSAKTWTLEAPVAYPSARVDHAFAGGTTSCVLFGGKSSKSCLGDTWRWTGTNWVQLTPTNAPPARAEAALAWDVANSNWVLFGGRGNSRVLPGETWTLNSAGTVWTKQAPVSSPNGRVGAQMCYDAQVGAVLLMGGTNGAEFAYNDTWKWTGTNWVQL